jgi:hypothetical protein
LRPRLNVALFVLSLSGSVSAQLVAPRNEPITGIVREEQESDDVGREVLGAVLFVPRLAAQFLFTATGTAATLIEEEQVVPRVHDLLHPPEGEIRVFPTAFVETGSSANIGARMIAQARNVASTLRGGYGGRHDVVIEARLKLGFARPFPLSLGMEAFHDQRSEVGFLGVGQHPEDDARNQFVPGAGTSATYREERERFIGTLGFRPMSNVELLLSSSYVRRRVLDAPDPGPDTISNVFVPGSVPGYLFTNQILYSELGVRFDSREGRGGPATGALAETYFGHGQGIRSTEASYARYGGRVAGFFPVLSQANVISPKLTLDGMEPLDGEVPFVELVRQPDFRGFDNRRDYASLVASLDYRWTLVRYIGARLFADLATVAPNVEELPVDDWRFAGGFTFEIFSRSSQLGSIGFAGTTEGFRLVLSIGVSSGFGDRQHRS